MRLRKPRGLASAPPSSSPPPHFPLVAAGGHCRALWSLARPSPGSGQGSLGKRCWGGLGIKGKSNEEASERVRPRRVGVSRVKPRHVELPFSERSGRGQHGPLERVVTASGPWGWCPEQRSLSSFDRLPLSVNNLSPLFNGYLSTLIIDYVHYKNTQKGKCEGRKMK